MTPISYQPADINKEDLAYLYTKELSFTEAGIQAYIAAVYDESDKLIIGTTSPFTLEQSRWSKVYLPEGKYKIVAECISGNTNAYPRAYIQIEKSAKYNFKCNANKSKDIFGLSWIDSMGLVVEKVSGSNNITSILKSDS